MIEKSAMVRQLSPQKTQRRKNPLQRSGSRNKAALSPDTQRSQAKSRGGNARCVSRLVCANIAPVLDHARVWAALLPKEKEAGILYVIQKLVIFRRESRCSGPVPGWILGLLLQCQRR